MGAVRIRPLLKWAGGKTQLLPEIIKRLPSSYDRYFELFLGSGALLFALAPRRAVVNDSNEELMNLYRQIKEHTEEFIAALERLDSVPANKELYYEIRARYNAKISEKKLDADSAAMLVWLNKHCFNGLYRVNGKGLFNVPYNNRVNGASIDRENLKAAAEYLRGAEVELCYGDFEAACRTVRAGDFVYFDSPYVPAGETADFTDYTKTGFSREDHERLADVFRRLDRLGAKLMLSNNDVPLVRELYRGFHIESLPVRRAINSNAAKRTGTEVLITND